MANILLINHYAGSPEMGMEFRPYYFSREWIKEGHAVHIIAGDYSHLRRKNPTVERDWQIEKIDGIYYHWVKTGEYHGNGVKRALSMERFVRKIIANSSEVAKMIEPDTIICSSTYPLDTYAGQQVKKTVRKYNISRGIDKSPILIHEVHDMWPKTLTEIGGMSTKHPFVIAMQMGENSAYKHSDMVVAMMPSAEKYIREHGLGESPYIHIPLGINLSEWESEKPLSESHAKSIQELRNNSDFIVGYFGGHALSNALGILMEAIAKSKEEGKKTGFVLVGDGVEKEKLESFAAEEKLDNVIFLPPIDKREIPNLIKLFDATYIGTMKSKLYEDFGLCMNKMADAMMGGKPIICATDAPATWVEDSGSGIMVPAEDVDGILSAIEYLKYMPDEDRVEMGNKGTEYCKEKLDVKNVAKKMMDAILQVEEKH